jgi:hypothetical protein
MHATKEVARTSFPIVCQFHGAEDWNLTFSPLTSEPSTGSSCTYSTPLTAALLTYAQFTESFTHQPFVSSALTGS